MTQCERLLKYMDDFGEVSTYQAMVDLGVGRCASRIYDLRKMGIDIISEPRTGKNRYGETTHYTVYRRA